MLSEAVGAILPSAAAVALSPIPIVAVVLVLDSARARVNGPAFALGWVAGLVAVSVLVIAVLPGPGTGHDDVDTGVNWVLAAIGVGFLVLAAHQWRTRPRPGEPTELPAWMARVDSLTPSRALVLGAGLSAANPKNLALTLAASASIARAGLDASQETVAVAVFVVIGSVTVVGAVLVHLVAPRWSAGPLGAVRRFMADHNAAIMMAIFLILGLKILGDALPGL